MLRYMISFYLNFWTQPTSPLIKGEQVANGGQLPSSFSLRTRDRATRLRSSDAPSGIRNWECGIVFNSEIRNPKSTSGIPDTKDRDVVAVQLELF